MTVHREVCKRLYNFEIYTLDNWKDLRYISLDFDIVHSCNYLQGLAYFHLKKTKLLLTLHGLCFDKKWVYYMGKILSKKASYVTSVSKYSCDLIKKYYDCEASLIYNGVDTKLFRPHSKVNEKLKILFVGRLVKWKNPDWVIRLASEFPQCDFIIHGKGEEEVKLKTRKLPNLEIDTSFCSRKELADLYANCDIFVFPSIDWFALVVLEAMSSGLPVLLNNVGGQVELLENNKEGLSCSNYAECKQKLEYLIQNEELRSKMGKTARKKALNFDWKIIAKQYRILYEGLSYDA